jgi:hypothetical protein
MVPFVGTEEPPMTAVPDMLPAKLPCTPSPATLSCPEVKRIVNVPSLVVAMHDCPSSSVAEPPLTEKVNGPHADDELALPVVTLITLISPLPRSETVEVEVSEMVNGCAPAGSANVVVWLVVHSKVPANGLPEATKTVPPEQAVADTSPPIPIHRCMKHLLGGAQGRCLASSLD